MLEVNAQLAQDVVGVGQHVHQVRDGRALVTGDIGDAGLQQGFGHRQDAFAVEFIALAQAQLGDLGCKRTFSHWGYSSFVIAAIYAPGAHLANGFFG